MYLFSLVVNDGPIVICKSFLDTPTDEEMEHVPKLQSLLRDFLRLCEDALVVNKRLITSDQIDFHKALEEGYSKLQKEMAKYLVPKKLKRAKSKFFPEEPAPVVKREKRHKKEKKHHKKTTKTRPERSKSDFSEEQLHEESHPDNESLESMASKIRLTSDLMPKDASGSDTEGPNSKTASMDIPSGTRLECTKRYVALDVALETVEIKQEDE